ncbi:fimbrillin family protein, partial [uncultured Muribaculum sp.]|uniref:fimbrillin family protein n=1 Tax=uncultured Muribaculum sp. TaxID=1918613 RepID=UPI0025B65952
MKKVLLFSAAMLALSSCSNTDVLEEGNIQQTNAIGFQTLVNKESRALTNTSFKKFWVYGTYHKASQDANKVIVFDGVNVLKGNTEQGTSTGWGYSGTRYWIDGAIYNFYAYSCYNEPLTTYGPANLDETSKALNIA